MSEAVVAIGDFTTPLNRATVDSNGALKVNDGLPTAAALSDATVNPTAPMVGAAQMNWNGTNWERNVSHLAVTCLASAARTATNNSGPLSNFAARGVHVIVDVTAFAATPSVVFTIDGFDVVSGKWYTLLTSAAITGTGTTLLSVYPGITPAANTAVSQVIPRVWRVNATHGDADSITYSVGAIILV
jgi:hypothetical protein